MPPPASLPMGEVEPPRCITTEVFTAALMQGGRTPYFSKASGSAWQTAE